ncbi:MAG: PAS domain-containing protein [Vagococcus sp.]|uniref:helix-turn-helix transcriptional regulator n=1 Tax=Vagococcus sp. TaxID=1933889 RepID=UPI002FC7CE91
MNPILKKYIPLAEFLASVLGNRAEIVLQEIFKTDCGYDASIVFIKNNISGRAIGSPGTDFLLKVLQSEEFKAKDYLVNYKSKAHTGKFLNSSSYFIKDDTNELVGMLCINIDNSELTELEYSLKEGLFTLKNILATDNLISEPEEKENENLYITSHSIIEECVLEAIGTLNREPSKLSKNEKLTIIKCLRDKGFFELKASINEVATYFKMAEVSIYKYLQEIRD